MSGSFGSSKLSRSNNFIIFGLPEAKSLSDLRNSVDELLLFLVGKSVPLDDMFRLGRLAPQSSGSVSSSPVRPRPILLKLSFTWDCRLVLSSVRKLKEFAVKRFFIREDLSPEERQKRRDSTRVRNLPTDAAAGNSQADASGVSSVHLPHSSPDIPSVSSVDP